jgi:hypothetical protein
VVYRVIALSRSASADRDPSDGSDEETEKRSLGHGASIVYKVYLAVQRHVRIGRAKSRPPFEMSGSVRT